MKRLLYIILILISLQSFSQTIEELEYDLSWYSGSEKYGDKIAKARLLQKLDPFNERAIDYICRYYSDRKIDSIGTFFDDLIERFPAQSDPLVLRAKYLWSEIDYRDYYKYDNKKIEILRKALSIDKENSEIMYLLAEIFYKDFLRPTYKDPYSNFVGLNIDNQPSLLNNSCDSALSYFKMISKYDKQLGAIVYFPMQQLDYYKTKTSKTTVDPFLGIEENCYFPIWYFANLSQKWYADLSIDYLFTLEMSKRSVDGLRSQLMSLEEPCLYNFICEPDMEIYRFTWLRSFDNPISIRLIKNKDKISLFWKIGKGSGGYEPEGLKTSRSKYISLSDYQNFIGLFNNLNIISRPNETYVMMTDGATWTLEFKTNSSFKAIKTNEPDDTFKQCCLYLLDLANIKIDPKKIY